jgi:hypothetical protein
MPVAESVHALGDEIRYFYRACTVTYFVFFEKNVNTTNAKTEEFEQMVNPICLASYRASLSWGEEGWCNVMNIICFIF